MVAQQAREGLRVVEPDEAWKAGVEDCAQPPVQTPGHDRSAVANRGDDQHVPAWSEAASDFVDEGARTFKVLQDENRKDAAERGIRDGSDPLTSHTSNLASTSSRSARARATSIIRGDPSKPTTS